MSVLFGRQWRLQLGTLDLTDLDLAFKVERSIHRTPNLAEIRVWNLSPASRATAEAGGIVVLHAGYEDPPLLFRGDTRVVYTERDGSDWITTIVARDRGRAYSEARFSRTYAPGTSVETIVRDLLDATEIGRGNLGDVPLVLRNGAAGFADGYTAAGPIRRTLNDLLRACGLRWSIQHGALQVLRQGVPLQTRSVLLSADSGLIESPTWDNYRRRRLLSCRSLIQAGIEPGRMVRVESALVQADMEVRKAIYTGDTHGNDWHVDLTLRARRTAQAR